MNRDHFRVVQRRSPVHECVAARMRYLSWFTWKGYLAADHVTEVEDEYFAIRNSAGLFDLMPMTKYRIRGRDATRYIDRLVTRDITRLAIDRVAYCLWCDDAGQIIDDGTLFRLGEHDYRLCSQERHMDWLQWSRPGFDVAIEEETEAVAALSLQGPTSCAVLKALGLAGIENLRPFALGHYPFDDAQLLVSRTGFTGDLGYELWIAPERAAVLWERLVDAGRLHGLMPIGWAAMNVARIEAGFIQAGVDFLNAQSVQRPGRTRSPLELGLERFVDFSKPRFNGRAALLAEQQRGSRHRLVRLDIEGQQPAADAIIYNRFGRALGNVTSAVWSPTAKANIALGDVTTPHGRTGEVLWVEIHWKTELRWERKWAKAMVVEGPFYDPPRRRAIPALDF